MLMLMLRCLRCCVEWIALYYFDNCGDDAVLINNADFASCADVTLYILLSGAPTTESNDVICWSRCGGALYVLLLLASVLGTMNLEWATAGL